MIHDAEKTRHDVPYYFLPQPRARPGSKRVVQRTQGYCPTCLRETSTELISVGNSTTITCRECGHQEVREDEAYGQ